MQPPHPLVIRCQVTKATILIDEKDELDSYLLRFECYAENASWEKDTWAIKLSGLLTGRAMDVYTRMSDTDANDYDKLKISTLIQVQLHRRWLQKEIQGGQAGD